MGKSMVGLIVVFLTGIVFGQGSLAPSSAPAETMKTLQQIEPRIDISTLPNSGAWMHLISEPGSYYLTSNLNVAVSGIHVIATNVTIDLNGFALIQPSNTGYGISAATTADNLTIKNGSIMGFSTGIYYYDQAASGGIFRKLRISNCSSYGISAGVNALVSDCSVSDCGGGIWSGDGASVLDCKL